MTDHVHDLPLSEAVQQLTGGEAQRIASHVRKGFSELDPLELLMGTVWILEGRRLQNARLPWPSDMSLKDLGDYFPDEPEDLDPDDPDTDAGKSDPRT